MRNRVFSQLIKHQHEIAQCFEMQETELAQKQATIVKLEDEIKERQEFEMEIRNILSHQNETCIEDAKGPVPYPGHRMNMISMLQKKDNK